MKGAFDKLGINDNGFYILAAKPVQAKRALKLLKSEDLRKISELAIEKTEVLGRRFRHCAARALMILKYYKGRKKSVGKQQISSRLLINTVNIVMSFSSFWYIFFSYIFSSPKIIISRIFITKTLFS